MSLLLNLVQRQLYVMDAYVVECIRTLSHGEIRSGHQMGKIRRIRNQGVMRLDMIQSGTRAEEGTEGSSKEEEA
jgi:hypothetical protein